MPDAPTDASRAAILAAIRRLFTSGLSTPEDLTALQGLSDIIDRGLRELRGDTEIQDRRKWVDELRKKTLDATRRRARIMRSLMGAAGAGACWIMAHLFTPIGTYLDTILRAVLP